MAVDADRSDAALVRYIPVSIVIGFTHRIAVLIAVSQPKDLLGLRTCAGSQPEASPGGPGPAA